MGKKFMTFQEQFKKLSESLDNEYEKFMLEKDGDVSIEELEGTDQNGEPDDGEGDAASPGANTDTEESDVGQTDEISDVEKDSVENQDDGDAKPDAPEITDIEIQAARVATDILKIDMPHEKRDSLVQKIMDMGIVSDKNAKQILDVISLEIKPYMPINTGSIPQ